MTHPAGDRQGQRQEEGHEEQLVLFRLADEHYGLEIGCVREIIVWQPVTRVPRTPPFIEGVINLRGQIIPVIDLRRRFGLPEAGRDRSNRIVVVEIASLVTGLVVDAVSEVVRLPAGAIEPPSEVLAVDTAFIRGIARTDQRLIILLNPERILDHAEQEALVSSAGATTGAAAASPAAVASREAATAAVPAAGTTPQGTAASGPAVAGPAVAGAAATAVAGGATAGDKTVAGTTSTAVQQGTTFGPPSGNGNGDERGTS